MSYYKGFAASMTIQTPSAGYVMPIPSQCTGYRPKEKSASAVDPAPELALKEACSR